MSFERFVTKKIVHTAGGNLHEMIHRFYLQRRLGVNFTIRVDAEFRYTGWKQNEVSSSEGGNGGIYNGGNGESGSTPVYGGHYSTLGLRVAVNF
jgi:hypothetical protein